MKRHLRRLIVLLLTAMPTLAYCGDAPDGEQMGRGRLIFDARQATVRLEIATTEHTRRRGLMYRDDLASDAGMLFVYPDDGVRGVWMKNTRIPLDILFLSAAGEVLSFLQHVSPCVSGVCEVYYSEKPARYMLEVNAGFVRHWRIKPGDKVSLLLP